LIDSDFHCQRAASAAFFLLATGRPFAAGFESLCSRSKKSATMNHDNYSDSYIRGILNTVKTIAMVGISPKDNRPSYFAFKYLKERGYRMIPVNPGQAGKEILGEKVYARLADIPESVDMVDVFRGSKFAPGIVAEALQMKPRPQVIWMQLTVRNDEAAAAAEAAGMKVVMNRCPKIEYGRLSSEISWMGVNSRTLTSKRAKLFGKGVQRMSLNRTTSQGGATEATDRALKDAVSEQEKAHE
jgi:predicted CoA-binding protein